jgi:hypothetical protein
MSWVGNYLLNQNTQPQNNGLNSHFPEEYRHEANIRFKLQNAFIYPCEKKNIF